MLFAMMGGIVARGDGNSANLFDQIGSFVPVLCAVKAVNCRAVDFVALPLSVFVH